MKSYVVVADNQEIPEIFKRWNDSVFLSKESAEKYIQLETDTFYKDQNRIEQIEKLAYDREMTEDEMQEHTHLENRWKFCWHHAPNYVIEEFDIQE